MAKICLSQIESSAFKISSYVGLSVLTHMLPLKTPQKYAEFLGGGEGVVTLPLPHGEPEQVTVVEQLLFSHGEMNKCTKKIKKERQV